MGAEVGYEVVVIEHIFRKIRVDAVTASEAVKEALEGHAHVADDWYSVTPVGRMGEDMSDFTLLKEELEEDW